MVVQIFLYGKFWNTFLYFFISWKNNPQIYLFNNVLVFALLSYYFQLLKIIYQLYLLLSPSTENLWMVSNLSNHNQHSMFPPFYIPYIKGLPYLWDGLVLTAISWITLPLLPPYFTIIWLVSNTYDIVLGLIIL